MTKARPEKIRRRWNGVAQGLGMALMEDYVPGRSENLHDYLIPTIGDVPEIETLLIEKADPLGPYHLPPGLPPTWD